MGWPDPRLAPSALVIMLGQNVGRPKQGSKSTETGQIWSETSQRPAILVARADLRGRKFVWRVGGGVFAADGSSESIWEVE